MRKFGSDSIKRSELPLNFTTTSQDADDIGFLNGLLDKLIDD